MRCKSLDIMGSQIRLRVVERGLRLRFAKKMFGNIHVLLMY